MKKRLSKFDLPLPDSSGIRLIRPRAPSEKSRRTMGVRQFARLEKQRGAEVTRFRRILAFAKRVHNDNPEALHLVIAGLARIIQSQAIMEPAMHDGDVGDTVCSKRYLLFDPSFPLDAEGRNLRHIITRIKRTRSLELGRDVVLPWPWNPERLRNAMVGLAANGSWGSWRADNNHQIELWEPIRVGWVHGGNHSLAVGILSSRGTVKPYETNDISPLYQHVDCNGRTYRRKHDNAVISEVASVEMAAIFEIGRMLVK